ncbi:Zn(2)-C6 fungal-type domain-containing protein [Mycena kentingensis (nom. inval.)]|nr:Zn(2)-C6 fungal-type domain-containing protein [Mycena kentingensis (nom. inval.)]
MSRATSFSQAAATATAAGQFAFDYPARVSRACSSCRSSKTKCVTDSQDRRCMRCCFTGAECVYVPTDRQRERERSTRTDPTKGAAAPRISQKARRAAKRPPPPLNAYPYPPTSPRFGRDLDSDSDSGSSAFDSPGPQTPLQLPSYLAPIQPPAMPRIAVSSAYSESSSPYCDSPFGEPQWLEAPMPEEAWNICQDAFHGCFPPTPTSAASAGIGEQPAHTHAKSPAFGLYAYPPALPDSACLKTMFSPSETDSDVVSVPLAHYAYPLLDRPLFASHPPSPSHFLPAAPIRCPSFYSPPHPGPCFLIYMLVDFACISVLFWSI